VKERMDPQPPNEAPETEMEIFTKSVEKAVAIFQEEADSSKAEKVLLDAIAKLGRPQWKPF